MLREIRLLRMAVPADLVWIAGGSQTNIIQIVLNTKENVYFVSFSEFFTDADN